MDIAIELENFHAAKIELVRLMTDEFRRGTSAAEVARALSSAFSRDVVTQYLGTVDRFDRATTALAENDLDGIAGAWYTGIAAPRETRLALSIGPEEVADHEGVPDRIRNALAPFHLTLAPTSEGPAAAGESTGDAVDRLLLDGDAVQIVRATPRT
ncbi:MAG: hypothetical protein WAX14_19235 [Rhodococcus sp. (in: high G+C Gram-positive bacteria)]|uniref:hypothetical protein n=1 Tax=Rhodococcus sp. TaxID=1831 RepID=UPI003BB49AB5